MADTRKDPRAPVSLKVRFKSATVDEFIEQYSGDISRGGIFIKTKTPMPVGTLLKFEFQLKDESRIIQGVGRVVWTRDKGGDGPDRSPGMGIKFIKMDASSQQMVDAIVEGRGETAGEFESRPADVAAGYHVSAPPGAGGEGALSKDASEFLASALKGADPALAEELARAQRGDEPTGPRSLDAPAGSSDFAVEDTPKHSVPPVVKAQAKGPAPAAAPVAAKPAPSKPPAEARGPAPAGEAASGGFPWGVAVLGVGIAAVAAVFFLRSGGEAPPPAGAPPMPAAAAPVAAPPPPVSAEAAPAPTNTADAAVASPDAAVAEAPAPPPVPEGPKVKVLLSANVPGVKFFIGDAEQPKGPLEAPAGSTVAVTARAAGYADATESIVVGPRGAQARFVLTRLPHVLVVDSSPPGATVNAGGVSVTTPGELVLKLLRPSVAVAATLPGYKRVAEVVPLASFTAEGERMVRRLTFSLVEAPRAAPPAPRAPKPRDASGMPPPVRLDGAGDAPGTTQEAPAAPANEAPTAPTEPAPAPTPPAP